MAFCKSESVTKLASVRRTVWRLVCSFDVPVCQMSIAQRHLRIGMSEQPGDRRHRQTVHDGVARHGMAKVVAVDDRRPRLPDPLAALESRLGDGFEENFTARRERLLAALLHARIPFRLVSGAPDGPVARAFTPFRLPLRRQGSSPRRRL